jgi:DoxX-like family
MDERTTSRRDRAYWVRTIAYWFFTVILAWEMVAGSMWDLLRIEYVRSVFAHLGYPAYMLSILGVWKLPCALALLVPRFPRLKEWAYAGAFFNYTGAAASHIFVGDGPAKWVGPLVFALFTLASWALRPPDRRLAAASADITTRPVAWVVPIALAALMLVVALLTLPKGPSPF